MKKDLLKAYKDAYAGMLFECAGYAKVIGRNDDAAVLFQLSLDFMGWNQTQKGIDKRSEKKYDRSSGTLPTKKEEVKKMKRYMVHEYRIANDGSEYETERYEITAEELDETREGLDELTGTAIDRYEIEEI